MTAAHQGLKSRVTDALNELRTLMLGVQILLGFQYAAAFQPGFARLGSGGRHLDLIASTLMGAAFLMLAAATTFHQIVERGRETERLLRFSSLMLEAALWPFALSLGCDIYLVARQIVPTTGAVTTGILWVGVALLIWQAPLAFAKRSKRQEKQVRRLWKQAGETRDTPLHEQIAQAMTEARIILPGAQALFGFQLASMLTERFQHMTESERMVHFISLSAIALSVILLMAPAPYHRVSADGQAREDVRRFAVTAILLALFPLSIGLSSDLYVVTIEVTQSTSLGVSFALASFAVAMAMWFIMPLIMRWRYAR